MTAEDAALAAFLEQIEVTGKDAYDWLLEPGHQDTLTGLATLLEHEKVEVTRALRKLQKKGVRQKDIDELKGLLREELTRLLQERADQEAAAKQRATAPGIGIPMLELPGYHANGTYVTLGDMGRNALVGLPADAEPLYIRADELGRVVVDGCVGARFEMHELIALRQLLDDCFDVGRWVKDKDGGYTWWRRENPTTDHAEQVLTAARHDPTLVRMLKAIVTYPAFVREGGELSLLDRGWNENQGIFCSWPGLPEDWAPDDLDPASPADRAYVVDCLTDFLIDFPFKTEVDRTNAIGLLLTPMVRNAIDGNVPMHGICAPQPRVGKTMLASVVLGLLYLARSVPTTAWPEKEEEVEKRIMGWLVDALSLVIIDNINTYFRSAALAMLITSRRYAGRVLGKTNTAIVDNGLTIVWTANNPAGHPELLKRSVPIQLEAKCEDPERRADFKHPDLENFVLSKRPEVLAVLAGMVIAWVKAGSKPGTAKLGGFEHYSSVVSGVLELWGFTGWSTNLDTWAQEGAEDERDALHLISDWARLPDAPDGPSPPDWCWQRKLTAQELVDRCQELGCFGGLLDRCQTANGKAQAMARIMRQHLLDRQILGFRVRKHSSGHNITYGLERPGEPPQFKASDPDQAVDEDQRFVDLVYESLGAEGGRGGTPKPPGT